MRIGRELDTLKEKVLLYPGRCRAMNCLDRADALYADRVASTRVMYDALARDLQEALEEASDPSERAAIEAELLAVLADRERALDELAEQWLEARAACE
jgi:hypothetical protein